MARNPSGSPTNTRPETASLPSDSRIEIQPLDPADQPSTSSSKPIRTQEDDKVELYRVALAGDIEKARRIQKRSQNLLFEVNNPDLNENALHVAAAANHTGFVLFLLDYISDDETGKNNIIQENIDGYTALHFAAMCGNVEVAKEMVRKNKDLLYIKARDSSKTPLQVAMWLGKREMAKLLMSETYFEGLGANEIFLQLHDSIESDMYDVALHILLACPPDTEKNTHMLNKALKILASKCSKSNSIYEGLRCLYRRSNEKGEAIQLIQQILGRKRPEDITENKTLYSEYLFAAAEAGNIEFIKMIIKAIPNLIRQVNDNRVSIFHVAVEKRHVEVFNLIYELGAVKDLLSSLIDRKGNTMLHLAAMDPPPSSLQGISGAALQMQRKVLWYQEVEKIVPVTYREKKNKTNDDGESPMSIFDEKHKRMRLKGEEWMKTTATSSSVVAALITTVAFAAAFTIPGGNDQTKGIPIFQQSATFTVFALADAISFFSSSIAVLMFLGILNSRYAYKDFVKSLPRRLMLGLTTLFISIVFMMVAFASAFFIIFKIGD